MALGPGNLGTYWQKKNQKKSSSAELEEIKKDLENIKKATASSGSLRYEEDIEDAWQPGVLEATNIYNEGLPALDPNNYIGQTLANLQQMQDPTQNPYLMQMLSTGQESIADQTLSSLGLSGRGPGTIDPVTGQVSDSALNLINNVGDYTSDFLGNQYQNDMNRALNAMNSQLTVGTDALALQQGQPYANLRQYRDIFAPIVGATTGAQQPYDPKTSGWDKLMGIGKLGIGIASIP